METQTQKQVIGYRVELPRTMEGPMEHPASSEVLYCSDGWDLASAKRFAKNNGGTVVARVVRSK